METVIVTSPKKPVELPDKLPVLPDAIPEMPDITPIEVIDPIIDIEPDDCNEAINNLVEKYNKK